MTHGESLEARLPAYRQRVENAMHTHLPDNQSGTQLEAAMRYAALCGGKRVRPILVYATGEALQVDPAILDVPACSIEFLHAYSLIHDDLPAMDDDDLRRGQPTCHIKFGEAQAILAGDALQALAFTTLASSLRTQIATDTIINMLETLGHAIGADGMAAGQAIDLQSVDQSLTLEQLEAMHRLKTGALIKASTTLGALCSQRADAALLARLAEYGDAIGLAFQIVDDILDVVADTEVLGKKQGADIALNKPTFPAILGLDGARKHADQQRQRALDALDSLDGHFDMLRYLANYIVERAH